ncbi:GFA family protein [soil metagenome]
MTLHSFEGGCHCRRVRFRVRTERLEALDCNCSLCAMKGLLHLIVEKEAFTLLSGEEDLTTYTFNTGVAKHMFCRVCGIQSFYIPRSHPDGVDVNVRCLDDDAPARFTVTPFDGREWEANVSSIR